MGKHRSGLWLGLIAGTALGILFAPKKGKELREEIKRERDEGGYGLDSIKDGFLDMGREVVDSARNVYESEEVQEGLSRAKDTAMEMAEEGKKRVKKATRKYTKRATKAAKGAAKKAGRKATKFTRKKIAR